jgi:hypothetical protein
VEQPQYEEQDIGGDSDVMDSDPINLEPLPEPQPPASRKRGRFLPLSLTDGQFVELPVPRSIPNKRARGPQGERVRPVNLPPVSRPPPNLPPVSRSAIQPPNPQQVQQTGVVGRKRGRMLPLSLTGGQLVETPVPNFVANKRTKGPSGLANPSERRPNLPPLSGRGNAPQLPPLSLQQRRAARRVQFAPGQLRVNNPPPLSQATADRVRERLNANRS